MVIPQKNTKAKVKIGFKISALTLGKSGSWVESEVAGLFIFS